MAGVKCRCRVSTRVQNILSSDRLAFNEGVVQSKCRKFSSSSAATWLSGHENVGVSSYLCTSCCDKRRNAMPQRMPFSEDDAAPEDRR